MSFDVVIRDGLVVDGTGAVPTRADIGVRDGRVVAIGPEACDESAARVVDATGLVVAPGFVDLHTHYDAQLFWDPLASPSPYHGVTTVFGGNCGFSLAPAGADHAPYLRRMMARVEGMPLPALEAGLPWDWSSFGDWLDRLDGRISVNAGFLCGHSALRRFAMGEDAIGEEASPADVATMVNALHEALEAGAMGFSTSQAPTHNDDAGNPVPSRSASRAELLALASAVADHPGTTLELILAGSINGFDDDEITLMTDMSLTAQRPLNWNVLGVSSINPTGHLSQLRASDEAASRGARVAALTLPHPTSIRLSFLTGFVLDGLPGWREVLSLPVPERLVALSDPAVRRRLDEQAHSPEAGVLAGLANWSILELVETFAPENKLLTGRRVGDIASERGVAPFDALLDVVVADELRTGLAPPVFGDSDSDWELRASVWRDPRVIVGGSDAGAHLDMMCGAVYSTSLLGGAVRARGLLSIEEAIRLLTDVPARFYGVRDRGRIADGYFADLVLLDPERIGHGPVHTRVDLPGGAWRLYAESDGVERVMVNGIDIVVDGEATGDTPGTLLRSGRDTESVAIG
jgi:N-acyl-D-aspartate/D-glutamate deacylase